MVEKVFMTSEVTTSTTITTTATATTILSFIVAVTLRASLQGKQPELLVAWARLVAVAGTV